MNSTSFDKVMRSISPFGVPKGDDFELISTFALLSSAEYGSHIKTIQRYELWARENNAKVFVDTGVDQVITTHDGQLWTVQNKGYDAGRSVPLSEMNNFLVKSENMGATRMLLVTSGPGLTGHAATTNAERRTGSITVLNRDWLRDAAEYPETIADLRTAPPAPPKPHEYRDDQTDGIEACVAKLRDRPETQLWRFCGTGKTIMSVGIADALGARTVAYFIPWLALMKQSIRSVRRQHGTEPVTMVAVCSDDSIGGRSSKRKGKADEDHMEVAEHELAVQVVHNAAELAAFVRTQWDGTSRLIVFSTYASSQEVVNAQHQFGVPEFDFTFLDESHNIVGAKKGEVAIGETVKRRDDGRNRLKSKYRVYATATPRQVSDALRTELDTLGVTVDSQDANSAIYGDVAQDYTIREAIRDGVITDYRVYVVLTSQKEYEKITRTRAMSSLPDGTPIEVASYATLQAMRRAHDDLGSRRFITFHSRVAAAENFANTANHLGGLPPADAVHGKMNGTVRDNLIQKLDQSDGILSNAQCLNEGVDIPALDTVVFGDPKSSVTDIAQALGRCVRNADGKEYGYVIIPVVVPGDQYETGVISDEEIETYTQNKNNPYKQVFRVIRALEQFDTAVGHLVTDLVLANGERKPTAGGGEPVEAGNTIDPLDDTTERDPEPGLPIFGEHIRIMGDGVAPEILAKFGEAIKLALISRPRTNVSQREVGISSFMHWGYPQPVATTIIDHYLAGDDDKADEIIDEYRPILDAAKKAERAAKKAAAKEATATDKVAA